MEQSLTDIRRFYDAGHTRSYDFRRRQLLALKKAVKSREEKIYQALWSDLKKNREECWVTENGFFLAELNETLSNLRKWMQPEPVSTNLLNFPSSSVIAPEPLGVVLVVGPWNYPFQLVMTPLIGAIAAGNCAVIKPSEFAPATAAVIQEIIDETFSPEYIRCVQGDGAGLVSSMMRSFVFDHVFYTGSTKVGRKIYEMAAPNLVPVTLELGGKSPCVIEEDANIDIAAKRIVMTKFSNAGQMCVAPDYVLVHASQEVKFIAAVRKRIRDFFGEDPSTTEHYGRIINRKQFDRLAAYLSASTIVHGGRMHAEELYIEPTVITPTSIDDAVMQEEIFGPILPVLRFNDREGALQKIRRNPNPLAFYVFSASRKQAQWWLDAVPSGGACVNNASWHLTNPQLPFGGRGASGIGRYHGKHTFDTFSHKKAIMRTPTWFDPAMKYPPFKGKLRLFKWIIR